MFEGLSALGVSMLTFAEPRALVYTFGATLLGILIGCMPGLSATLAISLLTTLTIKLPANDAILILICAYVGTIYGGSRAAILLNIPGTAANAAACLDGYQLARQGLAGRAMGIATTGSVAGSLFGILCLAILTPALGEVALTFQSYEFFWLALFGVMMSGSITGSDPLKGWIMGMVGLFVAQIGQDGIHAHERFAYGSADLAGGLSLIPTLVGAFGFAEVLTVMSERASRPKVHAVDSVLPRFRDVIVYWKTILRSGVIGVYIGILPGVGEDMAAWSSYAAAKRASKTPEEFGKGSVDGLIAAETGDNASIPGGIIPALALAIPGSAPAAVLLAAMIIHGVKPGPMLMIENPQFVYDVVAMNVYATIGILFFGLFLVRPLLKVLTIPRSIIMPIIFVLCTVGSFSIAQRLFDVWTMLGVGLCMFFLRRHGYQAAPFVLGLVLGDLMDKSLRRGLVISDGDLSPFFTRPVCAVLAVIVALTLAMSFPSVNARLRAAASSLLGRRRAA
ncbi:tripartite tricarboxylate transporter permease [Falsiroseomonas stagni]|uniref:Putative tricarboxylic transport membrane protein n=1 Tax=Falsiroseomonas stagni DSM 19981 TaxID=1123062 RepID=A0A1I3XVX3_9PROT|nr:tripartite tricarboxylate transporter permease [Falsiroseomonas stagni]SFK23695.1 putative tricarboxylic transport membrane protein [Falsiroseomonas stagni DSM 19981]